MPSACCQARTELATTIPHNTARHGHLTPTLPMPVPRSQQEVKGDSNTGLLLPNMTQWPPQVKGSSGREAGPGEAERQKCMWATAPHSKHRLHCPSGLHLQNKVKYKIIKNFRILKARNYIKHETLLSTESPAWLHRKLALPGPLLQHENPRKRGWVCSFPQHFFKLSFKWE